MFKRIYILVLISFMTYPMNALSTENNDETLSTLSDQQEVAVTIYNDNLALIKDQRRIKLKQGINFLAFRDVSAQIRPETAILRSLSNAGSLSVIEQNFNFDLLSPQTLLDKYVGKTVKIVKTNAVTGQETYEDATILSTNNGLLIKIGNRIESGLNGRIAYDNIPGNLRDRPTLVMQLQDKSSQDQLVELSYLTGGLSWKADYVAELNNSENKLDLSGWVTLTNTSGSSYKKAKLQLVAGDVNHVNDEIPLRLKSLRTESVEASIAPQAAEEPLLEYHLYKFEHATSIDENQTKQVALLSANDIPVKKEYLLTGSDYYYQGVYGDLGQKLKIGVFLIFDNIESSKLGLPLPKGIIRVYKKDDSGNAEFVGEDSISHTPKNETVKLKLGDAFDITAEKKQTDFKKIPSSNKLSNIYESAYEVTIRNAKKESITVNVHEPIPGDWKIVKENFISQKTSSNSVDWNIDIPSEGKTTLIYRVQVKN